MPVLVRVCALVILCTGLVVGCTQCQQVDLNAEALKIRELDRQWLDACTAGDLDRVMSYFAPGAIEMQDGQPPIEGLDAIRAWFESWLFTEGLTSMFEPDVIEVAASSDMAVDRGHWQVVMQTDDGPHVEQGNYVVIWRKMNGEWKVVLDITNSHGGVEN